MNLSIAPDILNRLQQLQQEEKFMEEDFYPGAPSAEIRSECERRVNDFLSDLISLLRGGTDRDGIFARAGGLHEAFAEEDTEEREKVDDYIGEAMSVIGLDDWTEHI